MTVIYVPRLIESVDQAEALPARTLIGAGGLSGSWITLTYPEDAEWDAGDFPFRALVPIEAVEEREDTSEFDWDGFVVRESTRLVTPWEEA